MEEKKLKGWEFVENLKNFQLLSLRLDMLAMIFTDKCEDMREFLFKNIPSGEKNNFDMFINLIKNNIDINKLKEKAYLNLNEYIELSNN